MREAAEFVKNRNTKKLIIAEVGVERGKNAYDMLYNMDIECLYLIDPYLEYRDGRTQFVAQETQDAVYKEMFNTIFLSSIEKVYLSKVVLISKTSEFSASLFPNEFFDFVYIDGNHDYEYIKQDIFLWWPKVKKDGVLGGHDFDRDPAFYVSKAVIEFSKENELELMYSKDPSLLMNRDWWVVK